VRGGGHYFGIDGERKTGSLQKIASDIKTERLQGKNEENAADVKCTLLGNFFLI